VELVKIEYSYSGLKNAVRLVILDEQEKANGEELSNVVISNICASFQKTAVDHIMMKLKKYFKTAPLKKLAIVGGASANTYLRQNCEDLCKKHNASLILAPLEFCSDNAAMIGRVAVEQYKNNEFISINEIDVKARLKTF